MPSTKRVDVDAASVVIPDVILPSQVGWNIQSPEKRLLAAILEDAIACITGLRGPRIRPRATDQHARREALAWIAAGDSGTVTFMWVCEHLKLDPSAVRVAIRRLAASVTP